MPKDKKRLMKKKTFATKEAANNEPYYIVQAFFDRSNNLL